MDSRIRNGVSGTAAGSIYWISGKRCVNPRCRQGGSNYAEKAGSPAAGSMAAGAIPGRTSRFRTWTFMRPDSLATDAFQSTTVDSRFRIFLPELLVEG